MHGAIVGMPPRQHKPRIHSLGAIGAFSLSALRLSYITVSCNIRILQYQYYHSINIL